jgi:hypothetical protein
LIVEGFFDRDGFRMGEVIVHLHGVGSPGLRHLGSRNPVAQTT